MPELTNIEKLTEALKTAENALIVIDNNYDFDSLAAALALGLSLEKSGKKITIFSTREPLVEEATLYGIAKITNKLNSGNLVISIPNALNSVDKVTHYLDGETLNIVVHPLDSGDSLSAEKVTISKQGKVADLVILVNTTWQKFLDKLNTHEQENYTKAQKIIIGKMFDSLREETVVSATGNICLSETVVWILTKLGLPIDADCAANLFQGIKFSTRFTPPTAKSSTFEAAAICLQQNPVLPTTAQEQLQPSETTKSLQMPASSIAEQPSQPKEGLFQSDISQTQDLSPSTGKSYQPSTPADQNDEVKSDWLVPKIFKSSDKPGKI